MVGLDRCWAIIPAAGSGRRMGAAVPKQYLPLNGRPVIVHTIERLINHPRIAGVVVVLQASDRHWPAAVTYLPASASARLECVAGGIERSHSVLNGLRLLRHRAPDSDWALIHDAVRPCLRFDDLTQLIDTVSTASAEGGLLGSALTDTIKRTDANGRVVQTVPRDRLWRAFTPQMFRIGALTEALDVALSRGQTYTDEAQAMEQTGARPQLVCGHSDNIKITTAADLALAENILIQMRP